MEVTALLPDEFLEQNYTRLNHGQNSVMATWPRSSSSDLRERARPRLFIVGFFEQAGGFVELAAAGIGSIDVRVNDDTDAYLFSVPRCPLPEAEVPLPVPSARHLLDSTRDLGAQHVLGRALFPSDAFHRITCHQQCNDRRPGGFVSHLE